jgi:hypothetical protein
MKRGKLRLANRMLSTEEMQRRLAAVERAVQVAGLDKRQAEVDSTQADAVQTLISSLKGIDRACIRVGSVLLVKYPVQGKPVVLVRNLSPREVRALERFPEIQQQPDRVFSALAVALDTVESVQARDTGNTNGPADLGWSA